ncbi:biotin/lipoate A/B protein ligase family protein [Alteribacillus sp. HJP-4]|uniref:lipoate--protein ligase family protein n=1 Tax=Alteribacillus sp. HJP-4 TaxID=2775394 RepID=UPI0035CD01B9
MNTHQIFYGETVRWIDHSSTGLQFNPLQSFALDDTFCISTGEHRSAPVMRAWVHAPTIVLGIQDSRLPHIEEGTAFLQEQGYRVIVRNSGGLAVVLDEGIFNLSLIFKEEKLISINSGYDLMHDLMKRIFPDAPGEIKAYEIEGSYCPGNYDLSINGRKFAGISQRRIRGGTAVQIYVAVTDSGPERAALLQEFYERAVQGRTVKYQWPRIRPEVMASLSEIYEQEIDIKDVLYRLLSAARQHGVLMQSSSLTNEELHRFDYLFQRVSERNQKALAFLEA